MERYRSSSSSDVDADGNLIAEAENRERDKDPQHMQKFWLTVQLVQSCKTGTSINAPLCYFRTLSDVCGCHCTSTVGSLVYGADDPKLEPFVLLPTFLIAPALITAYLY